MNKCVAPVESKKKPSCWKYTKVNNILANGDTLFLTFTNIHKKNLHQRCWQYIANTTFCILFKSDPENVVDERIQINRIILLFLSAIFQYKRGFCWQVYRQQYVPNILSTFFRSFFFCVINVFCYQPLVYFHQYHWAKNVEILKHSSLS